MGHITEQPDAILRLRMIPYNRRLIDARKAKGITQRDLSMLTGKKIDIISRVETLRIIPNNDLMSDIADALGSTVGYLFPPELYDAVREGVFANRVVELQDAHVIGLKKAVMASLLYHKPIFLPAPEEDPEGQVVGTASPELEERISEALKSLEPQERRVINLRFGFEDGRSWTLEEVGLEFNRTRERIRQIESKALRKLRNPSSTRKLKDYLD